MNDFTKEELGDLYAAIRYCYKQHIDLPSDTDIERFSYCLMEKIDFLIDNYCDHEWENICCQCTLDKIYCHKCEKDMGNLKERYNE